MSIVQVRRCLAAALCLTALAGPLSICAAQPQVPEEITDIRQLGGRASGVAAGTAFDLYTDQCIQDAEGEHSLIYADMVLSVQQRMIFAPLT